MSEPSHVEIRSLRKGDLNMRLVINHVHGHMRIMDYRVGNYPLKRDLLDELAAREGLRKVFTLVEKQDSNNWRNVGFFREGVYPAFFRTADAYAMSRVYDERGKHDGSAAPVKSTAGEKVAFPGRKLRKPDGLRMSAVEDVGQRSEVMSGLNGELQALPFGREEAPDVILHVEAARHEGWALAEIDDSFGHATLGFAPAPTGDAELVLSAYALNRVVSEVQERGISNMYGLSPSDDRWTNELYAGLGFKVTGRLVSHLNVGGEHATALVWNRRTVK